MPMAGLEAVRRGALPRPRGLLQAIRHFVGSAWLTVTAPFMYPGLAGPLPLSQNR